MSDLQKVRFTCGESDENAAQKVWQGYTDGGQYMGGAAVLVTMETLRAWVDDYRANALTTDFDRLWNQPEEQLDMLAFGGASGVAPDGLTPLYALGDAIVTIVQRWDPEAGKTYKSIVGGVETTKRWGAWVNVNFVEGIPDPQGFVVNEEAFQQGRSMDQPFIRPRPSTTEESDAAVRIAQRERVLEAAKVPNAGAVALAMDESELSVEEEDAVIHEWVKELRGSSLRLPPMPPIAQDPMADEAEADVDVNDSEALYSLGVAHGRMGHLSKVHDSSSYDLGFAEGRRDHVMSALREANGRLIPVLFFWDDEHGYCNDCSAPAGFLALDAYGPGRNEKLCGVCAANWAVDNGCVLERLYPAN